MLLIALVMGIERTVNKLLEKNQKILSGKGQDDGFKEFNYLFCDGGVVPDIKTLPLNRRTVHLRFMNLKAKVCKPFAR
jgi:prepilin-type processing-associated H-X9-DG protein